MEQPSFKEGALSGHQETADYWLNRIIELTGGLPTQGGFLKLGEIIDPNEPPKLCGTLRVGEIPDEKVTSRFERSDEKAVRLAQNPDHRTSHESRDETNGKFGGAVRIGSRWILTYAGSSEEGDEAFCLLMADELSLGNPGETDRIADIRPNTIYHRLV